MTKSMTGFAERRGEGQGERRGEGHEWRWELRSVNGRGLDLRTRLPDRVDGLEPAARDAVGRLASRGSLSLSCRLSARPDETAPRRAIDEGMLAAALHDLALVERTAREQGATLAATTAADVLQLAGVTREARDEPDAASLRTAMLADLAGLLEAWDAVRSEEGARLAEAVALRLDRVAALASEAEDAARAREPDQREALRRALERVRGEAPVDEGRLAQELALIAVRTDVSEEIDRLRAHVAAARDLLAAQGPTGRRLDFLCQEFAREANTLCAKAQSAELGRVGLDLKAVVDQMREQVQNVE